jgi:hypothetical protein
VRHNKKIENYFILICFILICLILKYHISLIIKMF